jgi:hypothetical protein
MTLPDGPHRQAQPARPMAAAPHFQRASRRARRSPHRTPCASPRAAAAPARPPPRRSPRAPPPCAAERAYARSPPPCSAPAGAISRSCPPRARVGCRRGTAARRSARERTTSCGANEDRASRTPAERPARAVRRAATTRPSRPARPCLARAREPHQSSTWPSSTTVTRPPIPIHEQRTEVPARAYFAALDSFGKSRPVSVSDGGAARAAWRDAAPAPHAPAR